jgi:hypothetical protein
LAGNRAVMGRARLAISAARVSRFSRGDMGLFLFLFVVPIASGLFVVTAGELRP